MIINVGDTIKANHGRTGEIINIGIATEATDIAAENDTALNAKTYDTSLGYTGAVTYTQYPFTCCHPIFARDPTHFSFSSLTADTFSLIISLKISSISS